MVGSLNNLPLSGLSTPVGSSVGSSASAHYAHSAKALGGVAGKLTVGKVRYSTAMAQSGDVFFHCRDDKIGHTNMTAPDTTKKIDSVDTVGVRVLSINLDSHPAIVLRFHDGAVAQRAALLAFGWANSYNTTTRQSGQDGVGYAGGPTAGIGVTGRTLGALMGSSQFGKGAQARLLKYRNRTGMAPKHVICSEMCILAFQLCMAETDAGFIKLDAKHSTPATFFKYLTAGEGRSHWDVVAYR